MATATPAFSCASAVEAPRCGVTTTDSCANSGLSVHGSLAKTSMPAPATRPSAIAAASASSSTMPPRAALTMMTAGLTLVSASLPIRPRVSGVFGRWTVMKSDSGEELVEGDQAGPDLPGPLRRDVGVVGEHLDAEALEPLGHELADPAEPDDADGLVEELDPGVLAALPRPRP